MTGKENIKTRTQLQPISNSDLWIWQPWCVWFLFSVWRETCGDLSIGRHYGSRNFEFGIGSGSFHSRFFQKKILDPRKAWFYLRAAGWRPHGAVILVFQIPDLFQTCFRLISPTQAHTQPLTFREDRLFVWADRKTTGRGVVYVFVAGTENTVCRHSKPALCCA